MSPVVCRAGGTPPNRGRGIRIPPPRILKFVGVGSVLKRQAFDHDLILGAAKIAGDQGRDRCGDAAVCRRILGMIWCGAERQPGEIGLQTVRAAAGDRGRYRPPEGHRRNGKAVEPAGGPIDIPALRHAYAVSGHRAEARKALQKLEELATRRYVSSFPQALRRARGKRSGAGIAAAGRSRALLRDGQTQSRPPARSLA